MLRVDLYLLTCNRLHPPTKWICNRRPHRLVNSNRVQVSSSWKDISHSTRLSLWGGAVSGFLKPETSPKHNHENKGLFIFDTVLKSLADLAFLRFSMDGSSCGPLRLEDHRAYPHSSLHCIATIRPVFIHSGAPHRTAEARSISKVADIPELEYITGTLKVRLSVS